MAAQSWRHATDVKAFVDAWTKSRLKSTSPRLESLSRCFEELSFLEADDLKILLRGGEDSFIKYLEAPPGTHVFASLFFTNLCEWLGIEIPAAPAPPQQAVSAADFNALIARFNETLANLKDEFRRQQAQKTTSTRALVAEMLREPSQTSVFAANHFDELPAGLIQKIWTEVFTAERFMDAESSKPISIAEALSAAKSVTKSKGAGHLECVQDCMHELSKLVLAELAHLHLAVSDTLSQKHAATSADEVECRQMARLCFVRKTAACARASPSATVVLPSEIVTVQELKWDLRTAMKGATKQLANLTAMIFSAQDDREKVLGCVSDAATIRFFCCTKDARYEVVPLFKWTSTPLLQFAPSDPQTCSSFTEGFALWVRLLASTPHKLGFPDPDPALPITIKLTRRLLKLEAGASLAVSQVRPSRKEKASIFRVSGSFGDLIGKKFCSEGEMRRELWVYRELKTLEGTPMYDEQMHPFPHIHCIDGELSMVLIADVGTPLKAYAVEHPTTVFELDLVARDISRALSQLHGLGFTHRDISTSNILMVTRGSHLVALLQDFGSAGKASVEPAPVAITVAFSSPEVHHRYLRDALLCYEYRYSDDWEGLMLVLIAFCCNLRPFASGAPKIFGDPVLKKVLFYLLQHRNAVTLPLVLELVPLADNDPAPGALTLFRLWDLARILLSQRSSADIADAVRDVCRPTPI